MSNPRVLSWLKEGKFYECLSGKGKFFLSDYSYPSEHDILLVVSTVLEWAKDEPEFVSDKFDKALRKIIEESVLTFLNIISSYLILKKSKKIELDINIKDYANLLQSIKVHNDKYSDQEKYQISCLSAAIKKGVPEFDIVLPWQG